MSRTCPNCGATLPEPSAEGLCLRCVARLALTDAPNDPAALAMPIDLPAGASIGDYELLEIIGRGGMGVVYKARQTRLDRIVAIKTIVAEKTFLPETTRRFRTEAEALAGLRQPNIVGIHEFIEAEGRYFIVMEFVAGRTLAEQARQAPLAPTEAARCIRKLAFAVQYAHQRGILHRDLKPSNVLIDEFGEPRLTDFGLARRLDSSQELTLSHQMLGSPHFMAPEQISARHGEVGPASDLYALGAMLYFLLARRPPFAGATLQETLLQVSESSVTPPRQFNSALPLDLETICLKCLEKEPARRYASVQWLADDLGRFLRGEPTFARPLGPLARLGRWSRRKPALATLAGISILALTALLISLVWAEHRVAQRERIVRRNAYGVDMHLAQQAIEVGNFRQAVSVLERWNSLPHDRKPLGKRDVSDLRGFEWYYLRNACSDGDTDPLGHHEGSILSLAFSPDGQWLASASFDGEIKLWDMVKRQQVASARHGHRVDALKFSLDSKLLFSGSEDGAVYMREVPNLDSVGRPMTTDSWVLALGQSTNVDELHAVTFRSAIRWSVEDQREMSRQPIPGWVRGAFSPDLRLTALAKQDGRIIFWDNQTRAERTNWIAHEGMVLPVTFSPDGLWLGSGGFDAKARVWSVATGKRVAELVAHRATVAAVAFSPDGKWFATASYDQTARIWETADWTEVAKFQGLQNGIWSVAFSSDSKTLATGAKDGSIVLWPVREKIGLPEKLTLDGQIYEIAPDSSAICFQDKEGHCKRLGLDYFFATRDLPRLGAVGGAYRVLADGKSTIVFERDGLRLWNGQGFTDIVVSNLVTCTVEFSSFPDQTMTALWVETGSHGHVEVLVLDLVRQRSLTRIDEGFRGSTQIAASPDLRTLAIGTQAGELLLWDVVANRRVARWRGHRLNTSVAFAPDGRSLASASEDGTVRLWDVTTQRELATFRAGVDAFWSVAISPDGRRLCAGTGESSIVVWDIQSQGHLATLRGHTSSLVVKLQFAPDGTLLSATDRELHFWRVAAGRNTRYSNSRSR